jgi:hypothetical protein
MKKMATQSAAPPKKRMLSRALKLRDAALHVRDIVEGWQPGHRIATVHTAGFRISYREPPLVVHLTRRGNAKRRLDQCCALTIEADGPLLQLEWDDTDVNVKFFHRGNWEIDFLRLARSR